MIISPYLSYSCTTNENVPIDLVLNLRECSHAMSSSAPGFCCSAPCLRLVSGAVCSCSSLLCTLLRTVYCVSSHHLLVDAIVSGCCVVSGLQASCCASSSARLLVRTASHTSESKTHMVAHINISAMGVRLTAGACDRLIGSVFSSSVGREMTVRARREDFCSSLTLLQAASYPQPLWCSSSP